MTDTINESNMNPGSAPPVDDDVGGHLPPPSDAPTFEVAPWNAEQEPLEITVLRSGESFLDGVNRVAGRLQGDFSPVSKGCSTLLPGMRVADDQIGVILKNGNVELRPPGAYRTTSINPWKQYGAVIPISRTAGIEFDPLVEAAKRNTALKNKGLGQSYRQIVLQAQQIAVLEDQTGETRMVSRGTYVYSAEVEMRGVIDLNRLHPIIVERETEDTVAANSNNATRVDQHGRSVAAHQSHGTTVKTTKRFIPAGYVGRVGGVTIARPEKGFVVLHKNKHNQISMTESICSISGNDAFVHRSKATSTSGSTVNDLEIEFGDMNHYAKSTPMLELKSNDNMDALCRSQIKWKQFRPDLWVQQRGAFVDPFDLLEEKFANMMRDWLLGVTHLEAQAAKATGFTTLEHQWSHELNEAGRIYGVEVLSIEITTLRFPHIDKQDEKMAIQLAETNLEVEMSRQNATKEKEVSKLNQATHLRMQEDRNREAEAQERQQEVERRKNKAEADTITKKAEHDTIVVNAEKALALATQNKEKEVALASAAAEAESARVRAEGERDAARLRAEGEIAVTNEKNKAQLQFLEQQAVLLKANPGLVDLLRIQNDLLKMQAMAKAAEANPNVVLLSGQEGLEARRMVNGHSPVVPGSAIVSGWEEKKTPY